MSDSAVEAAQKVKEAHDLLFSLSCYAHMTPADLDKVLAFIAAHTEAALDEKEAEIARLKAQVALYELRKWITG
jgi:hypothetical protein